MADVKKDLKYFMRNTEPEIVTAPGPDSFKDEDGKLLYIASELEEDRQPVRRDTIKKGGGI